jgi:SAM-dependent methyltransferase
VKKLKKALGISGPVFLSNDRPPDFSAAEIMERGGLSRVGNFIPLNDYDPISRDEIADASLDLVTCYIGLHHCPREKLAPYIESIHRVLRPCGRFVLRDHDAGSDRMRVFCALVHTVFNAGLGVAWEQDRSELRLFEGVDFWVSQVTAAGFSDSKQRLLQANDPSLNTLMCFFKS